MNPSKPDTTHDTVHHHRPADGRPRVVTAEDIARKKTEEPAPVEEIGGRREGLDPTRYGDWEKKGRCIDF
ncbi:MAG: DUF1674 domain-containing protein [Sinobacteraceae bacterium]|nr:DUF1674 domain-containing protein [Nevskiaceae bacterium]